jgi:hypothetical protein
MQAVAETDGVRVVTNLEQRGDKGLPDPREIASNGTNETDEELWTDAYAHLRMIRLATSKGVRDRRRREGLPNRIYQPWSRPVVPS